MALSPRPRWPLAIAGIIVASALAACGAGSDEGDPNTIKIGVTAPLTGTYSTLGPAADGITAYFKDLNDSGALGDLKVDVVVKDDAYDPSKTPAMVRQLVEDEGADMMCGPVGTGTTATVVDYLTSRKVPTVAMTGEPTFASSDSTIFEVATSYELMGAAAAELALADFPDAEVAVAFSADSLGEPFRDGAVAYLKSIGRSAKTVEFDAAVGDLSTPAAQLRATGAQVVLVNHTSAILTKLSKSTAQQGYRPTYISTNAPTDLKLAELAGDTLDGLRLVTPYAIGTEPELGEYRAAISKHTDANPQEPIVVQGWTVAQSCGEALRKAVDAAGGKPDADQILGAMESLKVDTQFLPDFSWSPDKHSGATSMQVLRFDGITFTQQRGYQPAPTLG